MRLQKYESGFTLVELLIVIALIAILSVGVLATINPVEQRNKAQDANTSNDSGEVLNAYERYYTNQSHYPWMDITGTSITTTDMAYNAKSEDVGFGLCTNATLTDAENTLCSAFDAAGSLITTDELKSSFLQKYYGLIGNTANKTLNDALYLVKQDGAVNHNAMYVCYIPKAKANRTVTSGLKDLFIDANGRPSAFLNAATNNDRTGVPYFSGAGVINAKWDFLTPGTSLFKCVP